MAIKPLQSITLKNDNGEDTTYVVASAPAIVETTEPASVASFSDGAEGLPVSSLIADITPVQNLNGQSAPYPAGGGKNKLPITATTSTVSGVTFTVNADGTISTSGTASAAIVFNIATGLSINGSNMILSGCPSGGSDSGYYMTAQLDGSWSSVHDTGSGLALYGTVSRVAIVVASGTNMNGKVFSPMIRVSTESSTFAPYSNICPITGWTGMNVVRNGFNQWDEEWELGTINVSGQNATSTTAYRSKNYIPIISGHNYYFHNGGNDTIGLRFYDADKNYIGRVGLSGVSNVLTYGTEYLPNGTAFLRFTNTTKTTYNHDISINYPSTDHDYHAYTGTTYPISWEDEAGTVYGGTLDVTNGLLTVTHGNIASYNGETLPSTWISDRDVYASGTTPTTGAQVVYKLATPVTYQLTPQAVLTILGQNNIWADTGDVEVAYCADTKMYIDKMISEL